MDSVIYSYKKDGNIKLSEHFTVKQFRCKNREDKILINPQLIHILEKLYENYGYDKIVVISGYRTPEYSQKHGGYYSDQHTLGNGADIIALKNKKTVGTKELCIALEETEKNIGIGIIDMKGKVHIDVRGYKCYFDETRESRTLISFKNYFRREVKFWT